MKIAGFTFVRNSVTYDYPIIESIHSILPICDAFYVLVGDSADKTLEQIQSINSSKIKIVHSVWNEGLNKNGAVLADETNKCMDAITEKYDWLFYLQADEIIHEKYLPIIKASMEEHLSNKKIDGLLFSYTHFFGTYEYVGDSRKWYRKEIRIIRQDKNIRSYKDAQGFRKNEKKLIVKEIAATVYHYGYIRNPESMFLKLKEMSKYYRTPEEYEKHLEVFTKKYQEKFDYSEVDSLVLFKETHPEIMKPRIKNTEWKVALNPRIKKFNSLKDSLLYFIEKKFGYRFFEYKNYKFY